MTSWRDGGTGKGNQGAMPATGRHHLLARCSNCIHATAGIADRDTPAVARAKLAELLAGVEDDRVVADRLAAPPRPGRVAPGIEQTFWALRKLLENLAAREPLVRRLDDIHWGEQTFLDLIEYLVDWIKIHPCCWSAWAPGDPEVRPVWTGGKRKRQRARTRARSDGETRSSSPTSVDGAELADAPARASARWRRETRCSWRRRSACSSTMGLLRLEDGRWMDGRRPIALSIPSTIHALLAARLDRLEDEERAVAERASVVGREFWRSAVSTLCPESCGPW